VGVSDDNPYARLETRIGYQFRDRARLESALTHKSYVNENPSWARPDNERLEFLGDAVLDLVVGHLLMEEQPSRSEGELSKMRAAIVNEQGLAEVAAELSLGEWLFLGRGEEQSGGRRKPSVMADAVEALIAAVYLDGSTNNGGDNGGEGGQGAGYAAAFGVVKHLFGARVTSAREAGLHDYKTRLQERAARKKVHVRYQVVDEKGPDHDKTFEIAATLVEAAGPRELARGVGKTKKEAEQRAAELALAVLEADPVAT
jgi:dsRNA-specific ribonuclease